MLRGLADQLTAALASVLYLGAGLSEQQVGGVGGRGEHMASAVSQRPQLCPQAQHLCPPACVPTLPHPQPAFPSALDPCTALGAWAAACIFLLTSLTLATLERRARYE